jgi:heme-degrading monooxygenase HmoA
MIARIWSGSTRAADADTYLEYLRATGLGEYESTPGNRGVLTLRSIDGDKAKFVLISLWDSMEAIRRFAGDDVEEAVFYPEDERFLVEKDERVQHFDVFDAPAALRER